MNSVIEDDLKYIANTYKRNGVAIIGGSGAVARDINNNKYVDMSSGIGVNSLGYCDEKWVRAVRKQAELLNHTSNLFYTIPQVELAKTLCLRTGYQKAFFSNSGAEANECAIKTARKYSFDKYGDGRNVVITLVNSFHGRTVTTLSATGQDVFHNYFFPFTEGFEYVKSGDVEGIKSVVSKGGVCAIMLEFIQGEGGVIPQEKAFIAEVAKICEENDILFIADEVQTGVGRTGKFLASEHFKVKPDITTLAKGLGGGLPIGATLFNEKTADVLTYSTHGTTFGGNPIVCQGANTVLEEIDEMLLMEVKAKGNYIKKQLEDSPYIESISGLGLMLGVKFKGEISAGEVVSRCIEKGALFLTAKEKLRMLPPLNITIDEIDEAIGILLSVLDDINKEK
jgi:acetylornithine/N-succinyldiaminopimelate aminotransferase